MCLPLSTITDTAAPLNWSSAALLYEEPVNNERCCLHWLWSISQYGLSTMSACYCPCRQWGSVIMSGGHTQGVQGDVDGPPIDPTDECKWAPVSFTLRGWLQNQIVRAALGSAALHRGFALWTETHCPHWPQLQSIWQRRSVQNPPVLEAVKIPTWQPSQRSSHSVFNSTGTRKRLHAVPLL